MKELLRNSTLIFLLVATSGINFFSDDPVVKLGVILLLIVFYLNQKQNYFKQEKLVMFLLFFLLIYVIQMFIFDRVNLYFIIKYPLYQFVIPLTIIALLPIDFHKHFVKFIYIWTIMTLVIWVGIITFPQFDAFMSQLPNQLRLDSFEAKRKSIILFTYEDDQSYGINRFAGFWHEPGAFAVLMIYSWYFSALVTGKFINKYSRIFLISILATMSTTAYFAIGILIFLYTFLVARSNLIVKIAASSFLLFTFFYVYNETEFMSSKVEHQLSVANKVNIEGTATAGRFIGLYKSLNVISTYPLFGRGLASQSSADITSAEDTGYGWPGFVANTGLILGLLYLYLIFKGMKGYSSLYSMDKLYPIIFFVALLVVLFSQKHTSTPLLFALAIFPFLRNKFSHKTDSQL